MTFDDRKRNDHRKALLKTISSWKIAKMNFQVEGDDKSIALAIMNIQDRIEYYINPLSTFFSLWFFPGKIPCEEKILVYGTKRRKDGSKQFKNAFFFLFHLLTSLLILPSSIVK